MPHFYLFGEEPMMRCLRTEGHVGRPSRQRTSPPEDHSWEAKDDDKAFAQCRIYLAQASRVKSCWKAASSLPFPGQLHNTREVTEPWRRALRNRPKSAIKVVMADTYLPTWSNHWKNWHPAHTSVKWQWDLSAEVQNHPDGLGRYNFFTLISAWSLQLILILMCSSW